VLRSILTVAVNSFFSIWLQRRFYDGMK
jgi:hypothetical protein